MPDLHLTSSIQELPRISKPQIAALKKYGIETIRDLLYYFPFRYLDFSKVNEIKMLLPGQPVTINGKIKSIGSRFSFHSRISIAEAIVSDNSGSIKIVWFNQPYLKNTFRIGEEVFFAGTPDYYNNTLQFTNPIFEKATDLTKHGGSEVNMPIHTSRLVPVYRLPESLYPKTFRGFINIALSALSELTDPIPQKILIAVGLLGLQETIKFLHFPQSNIQVQAAKKRLAFEELFLNQLAAQKYKLRLKEKKSYPVNFNQPLISNFSSSLPFKLTIGQKQAAWEILQDLEKDKPMNRLLEGDVGSGKTLVALIAALETIEAGLQVAFLAPTEILAKQHFETAKKFFDPKKIALLTSGYSEIGTEKISKIKLATLAKKGMPGLFIGTHALLEKKFLFKNLSLVIIDEQHRFGVKQRAALIERKKVPHLLSLTATPIPRTLQLAAFGELDISTIKTKPAGRRRILTKLVEKEQRAQAYEFIKKQVSQGRQIFVITPLIEESDKLGVKAAKSEQISLQKIFSNFNIGLLHGKLKTKEKEQVMAEFLAGKTNILVSTSVVEVGVDIPNASVMVIEGAERFGLAQLHQFRGRVGRAEHQSYCFVFTETNNPEIISRLKSFCDITDGFALAELDLKLRGFGEIFGQQQSGWSWKYFDLDFASLIEPAKEQAKKLLQTDPELNNNKLLLEQIQNQTVHLE